jgi:hypothetical protein
VRGLKNRTTWSWLYDVIEAQLYPNTQIKTEIKSTSPAPAVDLKVVDSKAADLTEVDMDTTGDAPVFSTPPPSLGDSSLAPPPLRREDYFAHYRIDPFPNGLPAVPAFPSLASLSAFDKYRQIMSAFSIPPPPVMSAEHQ